MGGGNGLVPLRGAVPPFSLKSAYRPCGGCMCSHTHPAPAARPRDEPSGCGGCAGVGACHTRRRAFLRARVVRRGGGRRASGGRAALASMRDAYVQAGALPRTLVLRARGCVPLPLFFGHGLYGCGSPSPIPHRTLLRAGIWRRGPGRRASGGGRFLPPPGVPVLRHLSSSSRSSSRRAAGARCPCSLGAGCASFGARHRPHGALC